MAKEKTPTAATAAAPAPWATPAVVAPVAAPDAPVLPEVVVDPAPVTDATPPAVVAPEILTGELLDMVTVTVPKAYKLRVDNFHEMDIVAGVQQMERCNAEHWYSVANGVAIYDPKA